ncbi:ankyrin repeat domain-containing protein [Aureibacter tunicatorum]|uniref:Ankyrin repeat protein n=1 Tax=Aureibacter tunicatorum TaxID=866807 RepID=A0AAE4BS17_9BACT|nr:ankyrin repeat domain-containing protein [Aureibacter tunicatorum]MDR6240759.1 ankyrin repeat protein [Aureibacter tunicatorum]BDD06908.1 hypothetical protein AUTU_43910 [Aureibacter tunicatorum]
MHCIRTISVWCMAIIMFSCVEQGSVGDKGKLKGDNGDIQTEIHSQDEHLTPLMKASGLGDTELVKELLKSGESPFLLDSITGTSPLHFAAQGGSVETAKVLVDAGALINLQAESNSFTPLMVATWYRNPEMIKYLLSLKQINPLKKDNYGRIAADFVPLENREPVDEEIAVIYEEYFKNRQAFIDSKFETNGFVPKNLPEDVNIRIPNGDKGYDFHTPLLVSALRGNKPLFVELLGNGADISLTGEYMKANVAHKAGYQGHADIMKIIVKDPDFYKIANAQGPTNGYTPLHDAIWHGHTRTAKILLDAGVDTSLVAWDGLTPLELAKKYNYSEIIELFPSHESK